MTYLFHDGGSIMTQICLTNKQPVSSIVKENETSLYAQMSVLYNKYIKVNSNHTLDLSAETRNVLIKYFEAMQCDGKVDRSTECRLFNIMDECCMEIMQLIKRSFSRFSLNRLWIRIIKDDVAMRRMLNSNKVPVLRNASSYSVLREQYKPP
eukprot:59415_1